MHAPVVQILEAERHLVLPAGILAEVTFMIDRRYGQAHVSRFMQSVLAGDLSVDWNFGDLSRVQSLMDRYADLPLGYADAAVIVCAERHGGRVLTLDHRRFGVVAREGRIQILP